MAKYIGTDGKKHNVVLDLSQGWEFNRVQDQYFFADSSYFPVISDEYMSIETKDLFKYDEDFKSEIGFFGIFVETENGEFQRLVYDKDYETPELFLNKKERKYFEKLTKKFLEEFLKEVA